MKRRLYNQRARPEPGALQRCKRRESEEKNVKKEYMSVKTKRVRVGGERKTRRHRGSVGRRHRGSVGRRHRGSVGRRGGRVGRRGGRVGRRSGGVGENKGGERIMYRREYKEELKRIGFTQNQINRMQSEGVEERPIEAFVATLAVINQETGRPYTHEELLDDVLIGEHNDDGYTSRESIE